MLNNLRFICNNLHVSLQNFVTKGSSLQSHCIMQRIKFSEEASAILECFYKMNPYPPITVRKELSEMFNVDVKKIDTWFYCRRTKERNDAGTEYAYTKSNQKVDFLCRDGLGSNQLPVLKVLEQICENIEIRYNMKGKDKIKIV